MQYTNHAADTFVHAWDMIARLLRHPDCTDIVCDVGIPIMHRNVRYNCRLLFLNGNILLIRPKMFLANDGNYRETRWFSPFLDRNVQEYKLPSIISGISGQKTVPFGNLVLSTLVPLSNPLTSEKDTVFGTELCEELFTPNSPHIEMSLDGVEIFTNGSGSHHEFGKLHTRIDLIRGATTKASAFERINSHSVGGFTCMRINKAVMGNVCTMMDLLSS